MNASDAVYSALNSMRDEKNNCRTSLPLLALITALSQSTVQRSLTQLEADGRILRRSKGGRGGGLLIRVTTPPETWSKPGHKPGQKPSQNDQVDHVVNPGPAPEGGLRARTHEPGQNLVSKPVAYRPASPHEVPESGAELVYANDPLDGKWRHIQGPLWQDPDGITVSIRSMSPELRMRLNADAYLDDRNRDAARGLREIVE